MLSYNELKVGTFFSFEGTSYEVLEYEFLRMQQRKPVAKTRIKNLINGKIIERNFHQNETFEEADIEKKEVKFLYGHRGEYWFSELNNPAVRFKLGDDIVGTKAQFLKANTPVAVRLWNEKIIAVELPIKMEFLVKDAPPAIRGNTAQGGTKAVTLETGAVIQVPLFVNTGDIVRVNTTTGEYVERVEKATRS